MAIRFTNNTFLEISDLNKTTKFYNFASKFPVLNFLEFCYLDIPILKKTHDYPKIFK